MQPLLIVALSLSVVGAEGSTDAPRFLLDTGGTTQAVQVGAGGRVQLQIRPAAGYKVNDKGPLSVAFSGTRNIILEKDKLSRGDMKGTSSAPLFSATFAAQEAGTDEVRVQATFVLCDTSGTFCELKKESVTIRVSVQPGM